MKHFCVTDNLFLISSHFNLKVALDEYLVGLQSLNEILTLNMTDSRSQFDQKRKRAAKLSLMGSAQM